jgi:hypothetical protein
MSKPFSTTAFKEGKRITTRDGREVKNLSQYIYSAYSYEEFSGYVNGELRSWDKFGFSSTDRDNDGTSDNPLDLVVATEKHSKVEYAIQFQDGELFSERYETEEEGVGHRSKGESVIEVLTTWEV